MLYSFNPVGAQTTIVGIANTDTVVNAGFTSMTPRPANNYAEKSADNNAGSLQGTTDTLKKLSASLLRHKAIIQWQTLGELDNDYFDIEHSTNGKDFNSIARLKGGGTFTGEHNYTFEHENIAAGKHYYRLIQINKAGARKYSQIIALSSMAVSRLQLYPNPATDRITVSTSTLLQGSQYTISSLTGQILLQGTFTDQHVDVQKLQPGQYWIIVKTMNGDLLRANFLKR